MTDKAKKIIELLELVPLIPEGGYFRESYRSTEFITQEYIPSRYHSKRCFSTAIYYLLTPETFSAIHKIKSDEMFHFYLGDPVEMLQLYEDCTGRIIKMGNDIEHGYSLQTLVPKDIWQGARLIDGGEFALFGVTVAPGFEYEDFTIGSRSELIRLYSKWEEMICKLT